MARMDGISDEQASWLARQVYKGAKKRAGAVPDPLRIYAHCPPTMLAAGFFEVAWARAKSVDPVLKDLCQLKVSSMVGCVF
jgi:hypothetical protein